MIQLGEFNDKGEIVRKDPPVGHVPTLYELYKKRYGKEPSGNVWGAYRAIVALFGNLDKALLLPPTVDPQISQTISEACERMVQDPSFLADGSKKFPGLSFPAGKKLQETYEKYVNNADPQAINLLRQLAIEKGKVVDK